MYIRRVALSAIKGFDEVDLNFEGESESLAGWTVITGDNGTGKTAFLKAISLALLGPEQVIALVPDLRGWIAEGEDRGTISVEVQPDHDIDKTKRGGFPIRQLLG